MQRGLLDGSWWLRVTARERRRATVQVCAQPQSRHAGCHLGSCRPAARAAPSLTPGDRPVEPSRCGHSSPQPPDGGGRNLMSAPTERVPACCRSHETPVGSENSKNNIYLGTLPVNPNSAAQPAWGRRKSAPETRVARGYAADLRAQPHEPEVPAAHASHPGPPHSLTLLVGRRPRRGVTVSAPPGMRAPHPSFSPGRDPSRQTSKACKNCSAVASLFMWRRALGHRHAGGRRG